MKCKHLKTTVIETFGFTGPVARYPYTDENPAAHGNITVIEECEQCGAQRAVNINQNFYEYSTWCLSRPAARY